MGKKDAEDKRTERHFSEEVRHWTKQERVATMFLSMPGPGQREPAEITARGTDLTEGGMR